VQQKNPFIRKKLPFAPQIEPIDCHVAESADLDINIVMSGDTWQQEQGLG
jgi:hypothetical protein